MKRIIFNNPPKDLMFVLKRIGLIDFHQQNDPNLELKGKPLHEIKIEGISENAIWGSYNDIKIINSDKYLEKYYSVEKDAWIQATIDLSDKGIEMLKQSELKNWKFQD